MNPIGLALLMLATLCTIGAAMFGDDVRHGDWRRERRGNLAAAWTLSAAAAWCLAIGLWLVVTRS